MNNSSVLHLHLLHQIRKLEKLLDRSFLLPVRLCSSTITTSSSVSLVIGRFDAGTRSTKHQSSSDGSIASSQGLSLIVSSFSSSLGALIPSQVADPIPDLIPNLVPALFHSPVNAISGDPSPNRDLVEYEDAEHVAPYGVEMNVEPQVAGVEMNMEPQPVNMHAQILDHEEAMCQIAWAMQHLDEIDL
ncbi:hypothetical protein L1987_07581 [Smallanthus sonchifolius]|uniref:Uncharacterized protein n=1 Tax=Smallanthus sonchifolius TaxID=185202 RepID=A0ACB9K0Z9_9ASTR|nr:hypothetical protein L1987_07581 [Smallanthus sonchifolius]